MSMSIEFLGWTFVVALVLWVIARHQFDLTLEIPARWVRAGHSLRLGFSHDLVYDEGGENARLDPYLERWIVWLPWVARYETCEGCYKFELSSLTLRLHKFWRGDDDSAPHDHPWWFVTFPLKDYNEVWWDPKRQHLRARVVKRFRFHYRPATHRHYVVLGPRVAPVYTLVISGGWERRWGFWPRHDTFVYRREWIARKTRVKELKK
jgi:hypothetical protein